MKVKDLFEARQADLEYKESRIKGALKKVTLALQGSNSGAMTRLTKRYERLDKTAKLLKEKRDELNAQIKDVGDRVFDAEDALVTRVIETVTYTVMLTAAEKAETKEPTKKVDYEAAFHELAKLVPELDEAAKKLLAKYTELIPAKDTPVGLRVKAKEPVDEALGSKLKGWWKSLTEWFGSWTKSYDEKLAAIKKKYPAKRVRVAEADEPKARPVKANFEKEMTEKEWRALVAKAYPFKVYFRETGKGGWSTLSSKDDGTPVLVPNKDEEHWWIDASPVAGPMDRSQYLIGSYNFLNGNGIGKIFYKMSDVDL